MGNIFSGWYGKRGGKSTTDDILFIDIRHWRREGLLRPWAHFTLTWKVGGKAVDSISVAKEPSRAIVGTVKVMLSRTPCFLGGYRAWFLCPLCRRRCCLLYLGNGFACRQCLRLAYRVEHEAPKRRALRAAEKIVRKLHTDIRRPEGKPAWRRWTTHQRLSAQAEKALPLIEEFEFAPYDAIARIQNMRPKKRGRPPKTKD